MTNPRLVKHVQAENKMSFWEDWGSGIKLTALIVVAIIMLATYAVDAFFDGDTALMQKKIDDATIVSASGKFAVEQFSECKATKNKAEAECIAAVIQAAASLHGEPFGREVARSLSAWLDSSKHLVEVREKEKHARKIFE